MLEDNKDNENNTKINGIMKIFHFILELQNAT